jgi:hypothetical protein
MTAFPGRALLFIHDPGLRSIKVGIPHSSQELSNKIPASIPIDLIGVSRPRFRIFFRIEQNFRLIPRIVFKGLVGHCLKLRIATGLDGRLDAHGQRAATPKK